MGSQAESVHSSLTSPAEQWVVPGSWADRAAGCAGGVGWFWGGWEGDRGCLLQPGPGSLPSGRGEAAGVCGALQVLTGILLGSAEGSTQGVSPGDALTDTVTSCFHQLPGGFTPEPIRAFLPYPYLLPAPGWSWMLRHAPKNHQHQGPAGTLRSSVPCHG